MRLAYGDTIVSMKEEVPDNNQTGEDCYQWAESVKNNSTASLRHSGEVKPWGGSGIYVETLARFFFF